MLIKKIISLILASLLLATMTACEFEDIPFKDSIPSEVNSSEDSEED